MNRPLPIHRDDWSVQMIEISSNESHINNKKKLLEMFGLDFVTFVEATVVVVEFQFEILSFNGREDSLELSFLVLKTKLLLCMYLSSHNNLINCLQYLYTTGSSI